MCFELHMPLRKHLPFVLELYVYRLYQIFQMGLNHTRAHINALQIRLLNILHRKAKLFHGFPRGCLNCGVLESVCHLRYVQDLCVFDNKIKQFLALKSMFSKYPPLFRILFRIHLRVNCK